MKKQCLSTRVLSLTCALGISISVAAGASAAETVPDTSQPLTSCQRDLGKGVNVQFVPEYKNGKLIAAVLMFRYYGPNSPKINPGKIELYSLPEGKLIAPTKLEKKVSDVVEKVADGKYFDSVRFSLASLSSSTDNLASIFLEGAVTSGQDDLGKSTNIRFSNNPQISQNAGNVGIQPCRLGLEGWKPKEPLQQRLQSKDSTIGQAAAVELLKSADTAQPMNLMMAAYQLSLAGNMNDATFWFYASYLRADYLPVNEGPEYAGLYRGFYVSAMRPAIDAKAMLDVSKMAAMLEKVLQWDDKTFETWCIENDLNSTNEKLQSRRKIARNQFMDFTKELLANRDKYEKQARDYKSPEQIARERNAEIAKDIDLNFTTDEIERTIGEHVLKVPANYLSPMGKRLANVPYFNKLNLTIFLPSFSGYTKDNWQNTGNPGSMPQDRVTATLVHKRQNSTNHDSDGEKSERLLTEFVASNPPKVEYLGQEFLLYHYLKSKLKLPTHLDDVYYITGDNQSKDSFYLMCHVNTFASPSTLTKCQAFFLDHATQIYINAYLPPQHFYLWREMRVAFRGFIEKWVFK